MDPYSFVNLERWLKAALLFFVEAAAFFFFVFMVTVMCIKPYMQSSFETVLESNFGLRAKAKIFHFSPSGYMEARDILLAGERGPAARLVLHAAKLTISPNEPIADIVWREKDRFSWKNVSFTMIVEDLELRQGSSTRLRLASARLVREKDAVRAELRHLGAQKGDVRLDVKTMGALLDLPSEGEGLIKWPDSLRSVDLRDAALTGAFPCLLQTVSASRRGGGWDCRLSGKLRGTEMEASMFIRRRDDGSWEAEGEQQCPALENTIGYKLVCPPSDLRNWSLSMRDQSRNSMDLDLTRSGNTWSCVLDAEMESLRISGLGGDPISGRMEGAGRFAGGRGDFILHGSGICGGPAVFKGMEFLIKAESDESRLRLKDIRIFEEDVWEADGEAVLLLADKSPESLRLRVEGFPLGRYGPVNGDISIEAGISDGRLKLTAFSPRLNFDNDPSQHIEKLGVTLCADDEGLSYEHRYMLDASEALVSASIRVRRFLSDPFGTKDAVLTGLRILAPPLFDLRLADEAPASMDLRRLVVPSFHIEDAGGRLTNLRGEAIIPFLNPRDLKLRAKAELDMERFPVVASSPLRGRIAVTGALWERGWSLTNLRADLAGRGLSLSPAAIFPELTNIAVAGRMERCSFILDRAEGGSESGAVVRASGEYRPQGQQVDLTLSANGLVYESPGAFRLSYDLPAVKVKGRATELEMSGPLIVRNFRYIKPVKLGPEDGEAAGRPMIVPAGLTGVRHTIDLDVRSGGPMRIANNAAKLHFTIPSLRVHGPYSNLAWNGILEATSDPGNAIRLPVAFFQKSSEFKVRSAQLQFHEDTEWNPVLSVQAEREMEDVLIGLQFEDRLRDISESDFRLTSSPPMQREQILEMLFSGEKVQKDPMRPLTPDSAVDAKNPSVKVDSAMMPTPLGGDYELRGEEMRMTKEIPLTRKITFTNVAKMSALSNSFESGFRYKLTRFMELELSQSNIREYPFFGVGFSKRVYDIISMLKFERIPREEVEHAVVWRLSNTSPMPFSAARSSLQYELSSIESDLRAGQYDAARSGYRTALTRHLHEQGFPGAIVKDPELELTREAWPRRGGQRHREVSRIIVKGGFVPGIPAVLESHDIAGWPAGVPLPADPWTRKPMGRYMVYNPDRVDVFRGKLLGQLAEHGYPAARVEELSFTALEEDSGIRPLNAFRACHIPGTEWSRMAGFGRSDRLLMRVAVDPGNIFIVEQLVIKGVHPGLSDDELRGIMGYEDGRPYKESEFKAYKERLMRWYEAKGYFNTELSFQVLISRHYPRISLHFEVKEGRRWRVGSISFKGLKKTRPSFILARIPLKSGNWAGMDDLVRSMEKINSLGIFEGNARYEWTDTAEPEVRDLVFTLEESPHLSSSLKLGYESDGGFQGSWRGSVDNIAGMGRSVSAEGSFTRRESVKMLSYGEPFLLGRDLRADFSVAQKLEILSSYNLRNESYLLQNSLTKTWKEKLTQTFALIYQEDRLEKLNLAPLLDQRSQVPSLRLRFITRLRASRPALAPTPGFQMQLSQTLINYLHRSGLSAFQADCRLGYTFDIKDCLLSVWHRWSPSLKLGRDFDLPLADRSFLGGVNSLRGYKEDSIAGRSGIGGESLAAVGAQWFYPFQSKLFGFVFHESGQVFEDSGAWSLNNLESSAGAGILLKTPVGPLQFYYGHPIGRPHGRFGLQIGMNF